MARYRSAPRMEWFPFPAHAPHDFSYVNQGLKSHSQSASVGWLCAYNDSARVIAPRLRPELLKRI
jgi:hypothetical protein